MSAPDDWSRAQDDLNSTQVIGFVKQRRDPLGQDVRGAKTHFVGQHVWARDYFVDTLGEKALRTDILNQEKENQRFDDLMTSPPGGPTWGRVSNSK